MRVCVCVGVCVCVHIQNTDLKPGSVYTAWNREGCVLVVAGDGERHREERAEEKNAERHL